MQKPTFIADVHLGRLAKTLRMLGFDTFYKNDISLPELLRRAHTEQRVLLTRNGKLSQNPFISKLILSSENPQQQLNEVDSLFDLQTKLLPFTRCIRCNSLLEKVAKERIVHLLPPQTAAAFEEFWQCTHCNQLYWKGSHYERMQAALTLWLPGG